jgi:hypothetical protein
MHTDLSGQLDQDGVQVTLIHSGRHKVDGNPYQPLAAEVEGDIQREIDVLRFLFAETVAAGRAGRLSQEAALATEAATYRGADAVAAGLADEIIDLGGGFTAFRQMVAQMPTANLPRAQRASLPNPRKETAMAHGPNQETTTQEEEARDAQQDDATETKDGTPARDASPEANGAADAPVPHATSASSDAEPEAAAPPAPTPASEPPVPQPGNLAEVSARLRQEAAEITEIAAQAGRLGIAIDAAKALREGTTPEALRHLVLERASAAADARDVVAAPPSPASPPKTESPLITAAKRDAAAGKRI